MVKRHLRYLGPILVLGILALAMWLLHAQVKNYDYAKVRDGILATRPIYLVAAVALTIINYLALIFYDLVNIRYLGHQFPVKKIALASLISYMVSNTFGMLLGGTAVRYRLYSSWGLSVGQVAELIALLGLTFWLGVFALAGLLFVGAPFHVPDVVEQYTGLHSVAPLGAGLLVFVGLYLLATAFYRGPIRIGKWRSQLPPLRISLYQILISSADVTIAGGVFYVLLPADSTVGFPSFLAVYLLAVVVAVITHVPGQFGVLDLIILVLYGFQDPKEAAEPILAAVLVYRVIYTLLPMLIGVALLVLHEIYLRKDLLLGALRALTRTGRPHEGSVPPASPKPAHSNSPPDGAPRQAEKPKVTAAPDSPTPPSPRKADAIPPDT